MPERPNILVVGSINMDLVLRTNRMPQPGQTVLGSKFITTPGGKGANQAVGVARLGGRCRFIGRVGDDAFGAQLALLGGAPVILAAPLNGGSWLAERLDRFGEGPCAFILGTRRDGAYKPAAKARWFGKDISWFDPEKLGWRLGFEPVF
jgi:hypothetical protein